VARYLIITMLIVAQSCDWNDDAQVKPADNTRTNERDRGGATKTPGDQGQDQADIDITASIRKTVVADRSLSMEAKNAKIITADGVVTLRGPVKSEDEKTTIAKAAEDTPGVQRVDNQLEVAAD
jgi:hyperosmotically inducible periplasmic protein